tara:strand:+ start:8243 stop:9229 length:987 start_codon:yes stop_codon:yes gene_type:complete
MADITTALSLQTRLDSFSDYIQLRAYKANTLEERAKVARNEGSNLIKTWFLPMPMTIGRMVAHNYQVVEQSIAYAMAKGAAQKRGSQVDAAMASYAQAIVMGSVGSAAGGPAGGFLGGLGYIQGAGAQVAGFIGMIPALQDFMQGMMHEFSDEPTVGMSTQELRYGGTVERSFHLRYEFIAKEPADVYGPGGILQILSELEAWSFPRSFDDEISVRDLMHTPPIFTLQHVKLGPDGQVGTVRNSPPLAAFGQPKLLVLRNVAAAHEMKSVIVDGNHTYPMISTIELELADMEPIALVEGQYVTYGNISVPRLASRSEIYMEAQGGGVS